MRMCTYISESQPLGLQLFKESNMNTHLCVVCIYMYIYNTNATALQLSLLYSTGSVFFFTSNLGGSNGLQQNRILIGVITLLRKLN